MPTVGDRIAERYELVSRLGEGGMGVVWRARDTKLGRAVALKLLSASAVGSDTARARLIREARAAAALEHEGIVRVYDVGETDDGGAFLVMELVRGKSLRDLLLEGSVGLAQRAAIVADAGRALAFAHAAGIVHRDVKPDNVMIREDGRVVVVDFGVAKPVASEIVAHADTIAAQTGGALTGEGQLVGTPAYLAPEQARGQEVSHATDQFALAVTAYEALSGCLPWKGEGVADVVASVLRDAPPPIGAGGVVPAAFDAVFARALAKRPTDRYPDTTSFVAAFEKAASDLPDDAPSRPSATKAPPTSTHGGQASAARATSPAPQRRALLGAIAIGATVTAVWVAMGQPMPGPTKPTPSASAPASAPASAAPAKTDGAIACPPFEVASADLTWLGNAAAALACERVQIARGGGDARTVGPAELAGAPRDFAQVAEDAGSEVTDARARGVAVARQRAPRWLDGRVEKQVSGWSASVVLRRADGGEIVRGEGAGVELFEAVGAALAPMLASELAPNADELRAMNDELDVDSAASALKLLDLRTAILIEDLVSLREACDAVAKESAVPPRVRYLARVDCARKLRNGAVDDPPPSIDDSTTGALITTSLAQGRAGGPDGARERAQRLERAAEKASSPEARARLEAAAAEIYNLVGDARTRQAARRALSASPKAFDWRTDAWHRLAFSAEGDAALAAALVAWHPWEPISHSLRARHDSLADFRAVTVNQHRAYLLSQRSVYSYYYGQQLLFEGRIEGARGVAEATNDDLLRVNVLLGEAKYGAALATVPKLLAALPANDATASLAFQLANTGAIAALTLERPPTFIDDVVARWVDAEPHHVIDGVVPYLALVGACVLAPRATGKRCVERLQQLRAAGKLPTIFSDADTVLAGAARAVADDYAGAAKVWRTMLRAPAWIQDPLRDVMAVTFDRGGAPELGDEVDAAAVATVDLPRTAHIAWVRAARRAQKRGDLARAKKLAQAIVDKWRFADEDIPSMREMRALLSKP